jgi:4'-phosphopantetheinyl transferase
VAAVLGDPAAQWLGVDVESVAAFRAPGIAEVLLHPGERASAPRDLATTWVRKEALLKAAGCGLATDPRSVQVSGARLAPQVLRWPPGTPGCVPTWLLDLDLDAGLRAAVAGTGARPTEVVLRRAGTEEASGGAIRRRVR